MMTNPSELPDDPRDCCRAAMKIRLRSKDEEAWLKIRSVLDMLYELEAGAEDRISDAKCCLVRIALAAIEVIESEDREVWKLVRHGTTDHRESDARIDAGLPPKFSPCVMEVDAAETALRSVGVERSRDQIAKILEASHEAATGNTNCDRAELVR